MRINLIIIFFLTSLITGCTVSTPTANDVKQATNNMFGALGISVVSIEDLTCNAKTDSSFACKYTTTMNDGSVLKSEGVFSYTNGVWERTD